MKVKWSTKRLASGKFQVSFQAEGFDQPCYGYLLTEPTSTVSEVVDKIYRHVEAMQHRENYFQRNLYSLSSRNIHSGRILVFNC